MRADPESRSDATRFRVRSLCSRPTDDALGGGEAALSFVPDSIFKQPGSWGIHARVLAARVAPELCVPGVGLAQFPAT
jgi:hypothetical protein